MNALAATKLTVPVDFLGVVIHRHGQAIATFRPPGFEHLAPIWSRHTLAEPVHTQAATDLGLIGTFCGHTIICDYLSEKICWSPLTSHCKGKLPNEG